jgi:prepilin-type N-terminal cleavage/methylation domain-containing protein
MTNITSTTKSGFTLIELLISTFIFAIIMTVVAGIFGNAISSYRYAYSSQQTVEDAQYAMNYIAKILRTSSIQSQSSTRVVVYDYSRAQCAEYEIESGVVTERTASPTGEPFDSPCSGASFGSTRELVVGDVAGAFDIDSSTDGYVGKVTMRLKITLHDAVTRMQTSVSLRDYDISGLL